ncbi:MAG: hypothetical protein HYV63_14035 [Candidatus Schekmanbacteria bacterium]|nr:hypothetical protein [Candidatus Schekmanbacteria bacterium]
MAAGGQTATVALTGAGGANGTGFSGGTYWAGEGAGTVTLTANRLGPMTAVLDPALVAALGAVLLPRQARPLS